MSKTIAERFWEKADRNPAPECWLWKAAIRKKSEGYGAFFLEGRMQYANRVAWILTFGPIPKGYYVCHRCDNPLCVNPNHLFLGTPAENSRDRENKERGQKGTEHPLSKLTDEKVRKIRTDGRPQRQIAKDYGVSQATIFYVKHGSHWAHVK